MPSIRTTGSVAGTLVALVALVLALVGIAAAQYGDPQSTLDPTIRLGLRFTGGLIGNLLLGGALVVLAPEYGTRKLAEFREDPGETVVWGLLVGIGGPIAIVVLAITIIGLLVAIPGILILFVVGLVGTAVVVVLVGSAATNGDSPGGMEVVIGALVLALVSAIPAVGGLLNWLVGLPGIGMVGHDLYRSWRG